MMLVGALALALVVQAALPTAAPPPYAVSMHRVFVRDLAPPAAIGDFPAILAHPLFNPARSSDASEAGTPAAPAGVFMLLGVATTRGSASAILRDAAGELRTLRLGESLDGWRLAAVGLESVVLTQGSLTQSLQVGAPPRAATSPATQAASR
jgi:hypothetical protein